ncbi:MAG: phosphoglycolate phosphatase [Methanomassiliicoccales archaeon]|nr:phosphoglycolate phosphatase [Methanomassiliicoccales archaeon]
MKMRYRAMVCDVDGTITDPRRVIQTLGIETLRKVQDKGYMVMLASGNVLPIAYGLSTFIGLQGPVVAENGGIVSYRDEVHRLFSNEEPLRAFAHLQKKIPGIKRLYTDQWRQTEVALNRSADLVKVRELLSGWPVDIEATGFAIHMMEKGHSKMAGVAKACQLLDLDPSEVVAFGDADNDAIMLRGCGYGVAVGNASELAKQAADYVAKKEHSEGVLEGLEHLKML